MTTNPTNINNSGLSIFNSSNGQFSAADASSKGDLLVYDGSAYSFLSVGANNTVLTLDSTQSKGLKWSSLPFSGDWILINSQSASSSSTIDFTDLDTTTYGSFYFRIVNCHPQTDAVNFQTLFSIDNGVSFISSGYGWIYRSFDTSSGSDNVVYDPSSAYIQADESIGNSSGEGLAGWLFYIPSTDPTKMRHSIEWQLYSKDSSSHLFGVWGSGINTTTSSIDAIRFKFSSGNIEVGDFYMYGLSAL